MSTTNFAILGVGVLESDYSTPDRGRQSKSDEALKPRPLQAKGAIGSCE